MNDAADPGAPLPAVGRAAARGAERLGARTGAAIFLGALLVRALFLAELSRTDPWFATPVGAEREAVAEAERIAREGPRIDRAYREPPLHPHLVAIPLALGGGDAPAADRRALAWTVKGAQALLDAGTALLIAAIASRLAGRRAALFAGALHALGASPVFHTAQLVEVSVATFLFALAIRLALGAAAERASGSWLVAGAALGLAALARESLLLAAPVLAITPWTVPGARAERLRAAVLLLLGAGTMICPVTLANHRLGGESVLIAADPFREVRVGNRPGGGSGSDGLSRAPARELRAESGGAEGNGASPGALLGRLATKAHALIHAFDIPDHRGIEEVRERSWTLRLLPGRSGVVIPLAIAGLALARGLRGRRALLLGLLAVPAAAAVATIVHTPSRAPLIALLAIPAGAALAELAVRSAPARCGARIAGLALLLALALSVDPHGWRERYAGWSSDPVALGAALERAGDLDGARSWYRRAREVDPAEAELRLGALALAAGDRAGAEAGLRAAVAADPGHAGAWTALGTFLLLTERGEEAARCFERAIAADPRAAAARTALGQMHEDSGRLAAARPLYEAARRIDPGTPLHGLLEARLLWKLHSPAEARSLLAIVERDARRPFDPQETKLRKEILEDLELWPEGPPVVQPPPDPAAAGED